MSVRAATLSGDETSTFERRLVGLSIGAVRIVGARTEVRYDAAEPYLLLELELGPPPAGRATWTTDDLFAVRQEVRHRLGDSGMEGVEISYVGGASDADPDELPDSSKGPPAQDIRP